VSPAHGKKRLVLNIVGVVLLGVGIPCVVSGIAGQFEAHGEWSDHVTGGDDFRPYWEQGKSFEDVQRENSEAWDMLTEKGGSSFLTITVGFLCSAAGIGLLAFANQGVFARYRAGEMVPVLDDASSDLTPAITDVASSVSSGLREGARDPGGRIRHDCGASNDPDDRFCKGCGEPLAEPVCPSCGKGNDADARFCDGCGTALA
jgi:hypothetical protein